MPWRRRRDRQAERLGGLQIDDELEGRRLLHRQIGRVGALQNFSGVNTRLAIESVGIRAIAYQAAGYDEAPAEIDSGNGVSRCQRQELVASAGQERSGAYEERVSMQLLEGGVDLGFGGGVQDDDLYSKSPRSASATILATPN
jgi:hypothetical protein